MSKQQKVLVEVFNKPLHVRDGHWRHLPSIEKENLARRYGTVSHEWVKNIEKK